MLLICSPSSDKRGASLGILFGGRTSSSKTEDTCIHCNIVNGKGQEVRWKARAGQYHELFWEEINGKTLEIMGLLIEVGDGNDGESRLELSLSLK